MASGSEEQYDEHDGSSVDVEHVDDDATELLAQL